METIIQKEYDPIKQDTVININSPLNEVKGKSFTFGNKEGDKEEEPMQQTSSSMMRDPNELLYT